MEVSTLAKPKTSVTLHSKKIYHEEYRHLNVGNHLYHCSKGTFDIAAIYKCKDSNRLLLESKEQVMKPDLKK